MDEIIKEALYCLNCKNKPCYLACPMHTNIPEFIQKIKTENYEDAYNILRENNIFSHICSLICPQEEQCEGACIRGIKSTPTKIGKLEEFVNEWAIKNDYEYNYNIEEKKNKKVAIIGSGPSGLSCAFELLKKGIDVTIYEKEEKAGGLLRYGIPNFRLHKKYVDMIVEKIEAMGAKFIYNKELGKDIFIDKLKDKFDAVFIAVGAEIPYEYELDENKVDYIYKPNYFLKEFNLERNIEKLGEVVVIGGGNVAIDCARCAKRMGAKKVSILYRRDRENMPARANEIEAAINDGVEIIYKTKVESAISENGKIKKLKCIKTKIENKKAIDVPDSEFFYAADTVIFAIGLKPNKELLEQEKIRISEYRIN